MAARVLIIAGSDSGGGAGIQADIKTVTMLGGHAMTAITAVTAQNTLGVQAVHPVPTAMVLAQIESVVSDIGVDAVKIGMVGSAETAHAVADWLATMGDVPVVFDPMMVATSGSVLADADTIAAFGRLMALASVATPNVVELRALAPLSAHPEPVEGWIATSEDPSDGWRTSTGSVRAGGGGDSTSTGSARTGLGDRTATAAALAARFGVAVLAKGGDDSAGDAVTDVLVMPDGTARHWSAPRIDTRHTHGTGCTLASAIATGLGQGMPLGETIERARAFVRAALVAAPGLGGGHGPMGHFAVRDLWPEP